MIDGKNYLNRLQLKTVSSLSLDLGKLFLAAGVIGFLFPNITVEIDMISFLLAFILSVILFFLGVLILSKINE